MRQGSTYNACSTETTFRIPHLIEIQRKIVGRCVGNNSHGMERDPPRHSTLGHRERFHFNRRSTRLPQRLFLFRSGRYAIDGEQSARLCCARSRDQTSRVSSLARNNLCGDEDIARLERGIERPAKSGTHQSFHFPELLREIQSPAG